MDAYLGQIFPFAGAFAPQGTAQCWGQQMAVQQNQALFSLLTNLYGGDLRTSFNLPDLRGRVLVGAGASPFLNANLNPGSHGGVPSNLLNSTNLPLHTHNATFTPAGGSSTSTINANVTIPIGTGMGTSNMPAAGTNYLGGAQVNDPNEQYTLNGPYSTTPVTGGTLVGTATGSVTVTGAGGTVNVSPGGGQATPAAFSNLQPYLAVTMYIVTMGFYPTRD